MKRREFLKIFSAVLFGKVLISPTYALTQQFGTKPDFWDAHVRDYLFKMKHFDEHCHGDIYVEKKGLCLLDSCTGRLSRLQRTVGYGNFHLIDFDHAIKIARNYSQVGHFSNAELEFLECVFYEKASVYGFHGEKPLDRFTERIRRKAVVKIPGTGQYLYKGCPLDTYKKVTRQLGKQVILTSGVRGIPKQFLLFFNKAKKNKGNLSLASRSLAPPGYSYHGTGDFDVGQVGFGAANFTERFTTTDVYKRLCDLGYLNLRYEKFNRLGVRFEPWHIKITV
jgi:hypothetical protein